MAPLQGTFSRLFCSPRCSLVRMLCSRCSFVSSFAWTNLARDRQGRPSLALKFDWKLGQFAVDSRDNTSTGWANVPWAAAGSDLAQAAGPRRSQSASSDLRYGLPCHVACGPSREPPGAPPSPPAPPPPAASRGAIGSGRRARSAPPPSAVRWAGPGPGMRPRCKQCGTPLVSRPVPFLGLVRPVLHKRVQ